MFPFNFFAVAVVAAAVGWLVVDDDACHPTRVAKELFTAFNNLENLFSTFLDMFDCLGVGTDSFGFV